MTASSANHSRTAAISAMRGDPGSAERLGEILETLDLTPFQKEMLRDRWLDQTVWISQRARQTRRWYYRFRVPVVVGGVAIPGLISVSLTAAQLGTLEWLRWVTFGVSVLVAVLAALEEIFHFGDRWRHYRRTAERLKSLGWQYMMLNGPFRKFQTHSEAYAAFTDQVEDILNEDVEGYLESVVADSGDRGRHEVVH
jgi:hypothetical protein